MPSLTAVAAVRDGLLAPGIHVLTKPFAMDALAGKVAAMIDAMPAMVGAKAPLRLDRIATHRMFFPPQAAALLCHFERSEKSQA